MQGTQSLSSIQPQIQPKPVTHTVTPSPSPAPVSAPSPSSTMVKQVQQSQGQTESQAQLTSPQTLSDAQSQVAQQTPGTLQGQHDVSQPVLAQTSLGQKLKQATQVGLQAAKVGAKVQDIVDHEFEDLPVLGKFKPSEVLDDALEVLSLKYDEAPDLEACPVPERSIELGMFEHMTGISGETITQAKETVETGKQILQVAKAVHSISEIGDYQDISDLGSKVATASKETFCALGGESTVNLGSKIVECCQKRDFESTKEMVSALGKFAEDDSYVASTERSLLANTATSVLGSSATEYLGMGVPFLSYGAAAMDVGKLGKTSYDWYNGNASGLDLAKSVVTATGSSLGATVLPFVGPLAASGVNAILSWWG